MIEGLIGRKVGTTEKFLDDGMLSVVTVIKAGPCYVVQRRERERDGYEAVQLGFEEVKPQRVTKPMLGHFKKAGLPPLRVLREFAVLGGDYDAYNVGDPVGVEIFSVGDKVDVTGKSKGRSFAGGMKRHGFAGQPDSHGGMAHRRPGSIGQHSYPAKVWKGQRMAGHMGNTTVTVQGLRVVGVDEERGLLLVRGSVPGPNGGLVIVKHTTKGRSRRG